jgi:DNA topoisomerase I
MSKLIIVESPTKVKTISKFLDAKFKVISTVGHFRDLPKSKLGVDVESDFEPQFDVIDGKEKIVKELKKQAAGADEVFLAPDPDREGEAIAWHILEELRDIKGIKLPVRRIEFHEITKKAVRKAIETPREIDICLVDAYKARRVLDRLVGYKISPVLWRKIKRGLSAGRVQSVAVRLICEREEAIREFLSEEYWDLQVLLETTENERFYSKLVKISGEDFKITNEAQMNLILADLETSTFRIDSLNDKEFTRKAPPPFTTSTLQQEASRKLGWSGKRTMQVAQSLYEGIEVDGNVEGLITYMRTDSVRISEEGIEQARSVILKNFDGVYLPEKPNYYSLKSKSGIQDAHEAIRPTDAHRNPDWIKKWLKPDQYKLYNLIWQRFVACQMNSARFSSRTADIVAGKYLFRAIDTNLVFSGFLRLYDPRSDERFDEAQASEEDKTEQYPLPSELKIGDALDARAFNPAKHFTKPPARYNDASLVKTLEEFGIGRPSTYAPIIDTIITRGYVTRESRIFIPTEWGFSVTGLMKEYFKTIVEVGFTADMEAKLDEVADGKAQWKEVVADFWTDLEKDIDNALVDIKRFKPDPVETEYLCDLCGSKMLIRQGRFGKFLGCSNFPKCRNTRQMDKVGAPVEGKQSEQQKTGDSCPLCNSGEQVIRRSKWGSQFVACTNYPTCKFSSEVQTACPKCGSKLEKRVMPNKRKVYVCVDEKNCGFKLWGNPLWDKCAKCGWFLVETKRKGQDEPHKFCCNPECENHSGTE